MKKLALAVAVAVAALVSSATDGIWLRGNSGNWDPGTNYGGFGKAGNWKDGIHVAGGGVATFNGNANATVNQNVNSLQLGGMAFDARVTTVTGKDFSLVGDASFIRFGRRPLRRLVHHDPVSSD